MGGSEGWATSHLSVFSHSVCLPPLFLVMKVNGLGGSEGWE